VKVHAWEQNSTHKVNINTHIITHINTLYM